MKSHPLIFWKSRRSSLRLCHLSMLLCSLGAAGLMGCSSTKLNPRTVDLTQRLHSYSYRQAVADFGCPDMSYEDHWGKTAEWLLIKPLPRCFDLALESNYTDPEPGDYGGLFRLQFDLNGQLINWDRVEYGLEALSLGPRARFGLAREAEASAPP